MRVTTQKQWVLVWDLPVRVFHWLLVISFAGAIEFGRNFVGIGLGLLDVSDLQRCDGILNSMNALG